MKAKGIATTLAKALHFVVFPPDSRNKKHKNFPLENFFKKSFH